MVDAPTSPADSGSHESGEHSPLSNFREQDHFVPIPMQVQECGAGGLAGFFGPGEGFNIPKFENRFGNGIVGGGFKSRYGGPNGGSSKGGIIRPTVVCKDRGPCFQKKVTCPAKCLARATTAEAVAMAASLTSRRSALLIAKPINQAP